MIQRSKRSLKLATRIEGGNLKEDLNEILIAGKVTRSKGWPPKEGQQWTNGSVSIETDNGSVVEASVKLTVDSRRNDLKDFEDVLARGNEVLVVAHMGSYTKAGDTHHKVEVSNLGKVMKVTGAQQNQATVTGRIKKKATRGDGGNGLILESLYRVKEEWRTREIKVLAPAGVPDHNAGVEDKILVLGKVRTGEKGPYVEARSLNRI